MTCEELRSCVEENFRGSDMGWNQGEVAEHVSACAQCCRFVEEQTGLARNLISVRRLAGEVPETVDAAMVARYRLFVGERDQRVPASRFLPFLAWRVWAWGAAVAAVLLVTAFWLFSPKRAVTTAHTPTPAPAPTIPVPVAQVATPIPVVRAPGRDVRGNVSTKDTVKHHASRPAEAPVRVARSLPEGFRSLMYCDALSCPDAMDMIRVQLPASAMPRQLPGFVQTSGSVTADVLVGPDGIARGIRFEEIEF